MIFWQRRHNNDNKLLFLILSQVARDWNRNTQSRITSGGSLLHCCIAGAFLFKMVDILVAVVVFLWIMYLWENYLSYRQVRPLKNE